MKGTEKEFKIERLINEIRINAETKTVSVVFDDVEGWEVKLFEGSDKLATFFRTGKKKESIIKQVKANTKVLRDALAGSEGAKEDPFLTALREMFPKTEKLVRIGDLSIGDRFVFPVIESSPHLSSKETIPARSSCMDMVYRVPKYPFDAKGNAKIHPDSDPGFFKWVSVNTLVIKVSAESLTSSNQ